MPVYTAIRTGSTLRAEFKWVVPTDSLPTAYPREAAKRLLEPLPASIMYAIKTEPQRIALVRVLSAPSNARVIELCLAAHKPRLEVTEANGNITLTFSAKGDSYVDVARPTTMPLPSEQDDDGAGDAAEPSVPTVKRRFRVRTNHDQA